jgi:ABC-type Zn2+ transport system substrate-binding protein/surface adhesin
LDTHTHTHTHTHACTHKHTHTHTHARTHARTHAHTRTHTYTQTQTHTRTPPQELGALLGVTPERAEQVAADMMQEGRLQGSIDQVGFRQRPIQTL